MKAYAILCLALCIASVLGEQCTAVDNCIETQCHTEHGWWLACISGLCVCSHDTHAGKPCPDGQTATCLAVHGDGCANQGLQWRCIDNVCQCSK